MSPFSYLLIAHLIGDYLFQTSWIAANKSTNWKALSIHVFIYTVIVYYISFVFFGGLSFYGIAFIAITHFILDRRTFVVWWVENVMKTPVKSLPWLVIMVDQIFHIIALAVALHL
jgi:hypothetical protein